MSKEEVMLTTIDNPHSPFKNYPAWLSFDVAAGYHTQELLARIAQASIDLSEGDHELALDQAVEEIIRENVSGMHVTVTESEDTPQRARMGKT